MRLSAALPARISVFALFFIVAVAVKAPAQQNWNVTLGDVRVVSQCESGGDRPYFPVIYFRSRIGTPGSTTVQVVEYEPHDWVSKEPFKAGLPGGRDHMMAGDDLRLPFWMGSHMWRNVQTIPNPVVNGRADSTLLGQAEHAEIFGVLVLALDNRNTPPDVVRELLNDAAKIVQGLLVKEVESGHVILSALNGNFSALEKNLESDAQDLASSTFDAWSVAGLLIRGGIGSFGSPDQLVGAKAFIMPAIDGFVMNPAQGNNKLNLPVLIGSLGMHNETMSFQGGCGNARYDVSISIAAEVCNPAERISALTVSVLTGEDDLRSNSVVTLVLDVGGHSISVPLLSGTGIDNRNQLTRTVTLPSPVARPDLRAFGLAFVSHKDGVQNWDNWDLAAVRANSGNDTLVMQTGRPLTRFTGPTSHWATEAGCTPPSRFAVEPPGRLQVKPRP